MDTQGDKMLMDNYNTVYGTISITETVGVIYYVYVYTCADITLY